MFILLLFAAFIFTLLLAPAVDYYHAAFAATLFTYCSCAYFCHSRLLQAHCFTTLFIIFHINTIHIRHYHFTLIHISLSFSIYRGVVYGHLAFNAKAAIDYELKY